jgi:hypothetical protein
MGVDGVMVIKLDIEVWEIGKGGGEGGVWEGKKDRGCWVFWSLCVFGCTAVAVERACVRNCRGLGLVQLV